MPTLEDYAHFPAYWDYQDLLQDDQVSASTGFCHELLGAKVYQRLHEKFPKFTCEWVGYCDYHFSWNKNFKNSPAPDFELYYDGQLASVEEFKNTSGNYYPTQYIKKDKLKRYCHYVVGAVPGDDRTSEYLDDYAQGGLILGKQIDAFPLNPDGSVKDEYYQAYLAMLQDVYERVIEPRLASLTKIIKTTMRPPAEMPVARQPAAPLPQRPTDPPPDSPETCRSSTLPTASATP